MRICLVSSLYPPDVVGGAEVMVGHLARGLAAAGHEVTVVTTARHGRRETALVDGVRVERVPTGNLYWPGAAPAMPAALKPLWHGLDLWNPLGFVRMRGLLSGRGFDVVHTHNLPGLSPAVWSAARAAGVPVVHTPHDYALTCVRAVRFTRAGSLCEVPCRGCATRARWLRRLSLVVAAVVAPSRFVLMRHLEMGFFREARTFVIPWGLPEPAARPSPPPPPPTRFLYVGQLRRHKGIDTLLRAFASLGRQDVRLDIAGDGEQAAACRTAAAADRRITVHGHLSGEDLERLYGASHVLVFPPIWWEVFGLVALEAFAHALPVVATRIGAIPEVVEDGVTGFLVPPGDVGALGDRLTRLAADPGLVVKLGSAAAARARRSPLATTVARIADVYREVASS